MATQDIIDAVNASKVDDSNFLIPSNVIVFPGSVGLIPVPPFFISITLDNSCGIFDFSFARALIKVSVNQV